MGQIHYRLLTTAGTLAGETHPRARLTEAQVAEVADRHAKGESLSAVAAAFDVTKGCVWKIVHGHRRGHPLVLRPTEKPVFSPALERRSSSVAEANAAGHGLSELERMTLIELADAGWPVARVASHFCITHGQVRAILAAAAADRHELLPVRRSCSDPLPSLPPVSDQDEQDAGQRAMQLLVHTVSHHYP